MRIFSYIRGSGGYAFSDYPCAAAMEEKTVTEDGGTYRKSGGSIRIMTSKDISVKPGDFAALSTDRKVPDKAADYMITAVRDNRWGGLPHWRLIVNGGRKGE